MILVWKMSNLFKISKLQQLLIILMIKIGVIIYGFN